jgi:hypothetical protein
MQRGQSQRGRSEGVEWEGENERRPSRRGRTEGAESEGENERGLGLRARCGVGGVGDVEVMGWSGNGRI